MKVKELKAVLNYTDRHDEDDLMIHLAEPSIGPIAMSGVKSAGFGFDWESGKLIINPEKRLSEKTQPEDVYHMASDLLMYLATNPAKRYKYEIDTAKRILLKAGYTQEQLDKYRSIFHKEKV
jgi:hypothetical protein